MNLRHLTPQKKAAITRLANRIGAGELNALEYYASKPDIVHAFKTTPERAAMFEVSGFNVVGKRGGKRERVIIAKSTKEETVRVRSDRVITERPIYTGKGVEKIRTTTRLFKDRAQVIENAERLFYKLESRKNPRMLLMARLGGRPWTRSFDSKAAFQAYIKDWKPKNGERDELVDQIVLAEFIDTSIDEDWLDYDEESDE